MDEQMDNYFELYHLPVSFHPDQQLVKARFYELSRQYHPDRYTQATHTEKLESLTMAAMNNKAYKTLGNADATMAYVLKLTETLKDEEPNTLPPSFLGEMMDLNEAISDYEMEPDNAAARETVTTQLNELLGDWSAKADALTSRFDQGEQAGDLLFQIKDMYFRKKYLLRIEERIHKFAAR